MNNKSKSVKKEKSKSYVRELAIQHVDWFVTTIAPLLVEEFVHGYKHGYEDGRNVYEAEIEYLISELEKQKK